MYVAVVMSDPEATLELALVENLRNAWGGGDLTWLAPDKAADFQLQYVPDNLDQVWADLQVLRVDLAIVPAHGRRKRLLLADMDSTMIQQECIDELAEVAGVGEAVRGVTKKAMNGDLDFAEALEARVALLEGLGADTIGEVLDQRITMMPGGDVLVATMKANGAYAALVSGGFTAFTSAVAAQLGFDENRANTLETANNKLTGRVVPPILGRDAKVAALQDLVLKLDITEVDVLAVGDGANDLGMLERAGLGVALHAKPSVQAACETRVNFGDLRALLYLQGYAETEFVQAKSPGDGRT